MIIDRPPSDEDLANTLRTTAELLHGYIRLARQRGLSVSFSTDIHSDVWEVSDVKIVREL